MTIRRQRVIRIPLRPMMPVPLPTARPEWKESRGPKCVARASIAGASFNGAKSMDIVLRDQTRLRAKLESSCPAIDFYTNFYLQPTADGNICADRDSFHSRSGGECQIERFRKLTPNTPRIKSR